MTPPARPRRTFGPVVLAGLAAGTLAAVATARPAAEAIRVPADVLVADQPAADLPLASTLSLVVLAAWGAAVVLRGRVRRGVLVLGLLAALGAGAALAAGAGSLPGAVREPYAAAGYAAVEVSLTAWYSAACIGTVLSVLALAAAVRLAPAWPEMSTRYDAPADAPTDAGAGDGEARDAPGRRTADAGLEVDGARNLELWRALDEGRDPTAGPS